MANASHRHSDDYLIKISCVLSTIATDVRSAALSASHEIGLVRKAAVAQSLWAGEQTKSLVAAQEIYREHRRRDRIFEDYGATLNDHAHDLLLYLFIGHHRQDAISVSSACHASCAAPTTGLRLVAKLEEHRLIERAEDSFDKRRQLLRLTKTGLELMRRYLDGAEPQSAFM